MIVSNVKPMYLTFNSVLLVFQSEL